MFLYSINYFFFMFNVPKIIVYWKKQLEDTLFYILMLSVLKIYIFSNFRVFTQFENLENSN